MEFLTTRVRRTTKVNSLSQETALSIPRFLTATFYRDRHLDNRSVGERDRLKQLNMIPFDNPSHCLLSYFHWPTSLRAHILIQSHDQNAGS
jgi:hypothetical protein